MPVTGAACLVGQYSDGSQAWVYGAEATAYRRDGPDRRAMAESAVGVHVFAGGFTAGVRAAGVTVPAQLEVHGLGRETVAAHLPGTEFVQAPRWEDWPRVDARWSFGNPRCTGFSCTTAGLGEQAHGPWAKCTIDIHDLCQYSVKSGLDLVIWESVQQAYTVGRRLLDRLRDELFAPNGYRIAHVFLNAASFGNAQKRKRYFFVAYRGGNFCALPPELPDRQRWVSDVLTDPYLAGREVRTAHVDGLGWNGDPDTCDRMVGEQAAVLPLLRQHESHNGVFKRLRLDAVAPLSQDKWDHRSSERPFSLHCLRRIRWDACCPTIASSSRNFSHPLLDRKLSVREIARLMGWPEGMTPKGRHPIGQVGKGVCPEVAQWLAEQAKLFLGGAWGSDDWSTRWCPHTRRWLGEEFGRAAPVEKTLDLGDYMPPDPSPWARGRKGELVA
jgi:site-specific DNA-cytosine methylase